MVSHWSLSDSKCPQVSRTLLSILADLNKAVVWIVSTRPLIFKSSSHCTNHLVTVPRAPITIGIIVTSCSTAFSVPLQGRGTYPSFHIFQFHSAVRRDRKVHNSASPLFFLLIMSRDIPRRR